MPNMTPTDDPAPDFATWWHNEGSGMTPQDGEDAATHVHRVCKIAWLNGAFKATELISETLAESMEAKL